MTPLRLTIATPCSVDWESMPGDERVRRCPACDKNVYRIAALTRAEVDRLIADRETLRPCIRLRRRPDGTVVTRDCLTVTSRAVAWLRVKAAVAAGFVLSLWGGVVPARERETTRPSQAETATADGAKTRTPRKHRKKAKEPPPAPPPVLKKVPKREVEDQGGMGL